MTQTIAMTFPYKEFPIQYTNPLNPRKTTLLRPVIQIDFESKEGGFGYLALIDSGADYCLFHGSIGEQLGLDVKKGKALSFYGTSGKQQIAYFHKVRFSAAGKEIEAMVGFSYQINELAFGILGQEGFFDQFTITFNLNKKFITLN
jgi:predicted aspartyl protease